MPNHVHTPEDGRPVPARRRPLHGSAGPSEYRRAVAHMRPHPRAPAQTQLHIRTRIRTCTRKRTRARAHARTHACTHACASARARAPTHTHTHTHTPEERTPLPARRRPLHGGLRPGPPRRVPPRRRHGPPGPFHTAVRRPAARPAAAGGGRWARGARRWRQHNEQRGRG
jgi:hypothetical protein